MIIGGNDCPENIGKYGAISEIIEGDGEDGLTHRVDGETISPCPVVGDSGHQWCAPHELMPIDLAEPGTDRAVIAIHGGAADEMAGFAERLRERGIEVVVIGCGGSGLQFTGRSNYSSTAALLPPAELLERQFPIFKKGSQDRLRDRWGRLKR